MATETEQLNEVFDLFKLEQDPILLDRIKQQFETEEKLSRAHIHNTVLLNYGGLDMRHPAFKRASEGYQTPTKEMVALVLALLDEIGFDASFIAKELGVTEDELLKYPPRYSDWRLMLIFAGIVNETMLLPAQCRASVLKDDGSTFGYFTDGFAEATAVHA